MTANKVTTKQKALRVGSAVAVSALGFLTVPAPRRQRPAANGDSRRRQRLYQRSGTELLFQAAGKTVTQAAASWTGPNGAKGSGYLNGSISGAGVNFTWKGDGGPPNFTGGATITFVGTVNDDGNANGTVSYSTGGPGSFSSNKRTCLDAPPQRSHSPSRSNRSRSRRRSPWRP